VACVDDQETVALPLFVITADGRDPGALVFLPCTPLAEIVAVGAVAEAGLTVMEKFFWAVPPPPPTSEQFTV
jgi:hypothetical protein